MRCRAIAGVLEKLGAQVAFAVADARPAAFLGPWSNRAEIVGGDCKALVREDGLVLGNVCRSHRARSLLVDSYGVSEAFFSAVREEAPMIRVVYIDDLFNFSVGKLNRPRRWDVDAVVAYGFGLERAGFDETYAGVNTELMIGQRYAPLRPGFTGKDRLNSEHVRRIMVTTGSTNPSCVLETMASAALTAVPNAEIDVVVGALSNFSLPADASMRVHRGLTDLSSLMYDADLVVSAAGTTLYELCAVGVPTVAVPIVANQLPNADGFDATHLGMVVRPGDAFVTRLTATIRALATDAFMRANLSSRMCATVDGKGSLRIAHFLVDSQPQPNT